MRQATRWRAAVETALLLFATLAWVAACGDGATSARLLRNDVTTDFAVRPPTMFFGCCGQFLIGGPGVSSRAFRSRSLGHISWTEWSTVADGSGLLWIDDCNPTCAQGKFQSQPVSITASRAVGERYTRLLLVYGRNGGETHDRLTLKRLTDTRIPAYAWFRVANHVSSAAAMFASRNGPSAWR